MLSPNDCKPQIKIKQFLSVPPPPLSSSCSLHSEPSWRLPSPATYARHLAPPSSPEQELANPTAQPLITANVSTHETKWLRVRRAEKSTPASARPPARPPAHATLPSPATWQAGGKGCSREGVKPVSSRWRSQYSAQSCFRSVGRSPRGVFA